LGGAGRTHLGEGSLFLEAFHTRLNDRAADRRDLRIDEIFPILAGRDRFALLVLLQCPLGGPDLLLLLLQPIAQPSRCSVGRAVAEIHRLFDVELRQRIDGLLCDPWVVRAKVQVDEPASRNRLQRQSGAEGRDSWRQGYAGTIDNRLGPAPKKLPLEPFPRRHQGSHLEFFSLVQLKFPDDLLGDLLTSQELELSRHVGQLGHVEAIASSRKHRLSAAIDQDLRRGPIDGASRIVVERGHEQAHDQAREDQRTALV
jgi:hypothetical protein